MIWFCLFWLLCGYTGAILRQDAVYTIAEVCSTDLGIVDVVVINLAEPDYEQFRYSMHENVIKHRFEYDYYCVFESDRIGIVVVELTGRPEDGTSGINKKSSIWFSTRNTFTAESFVTEHGLTLVLDVVINSTAFYDECARRYRDEVLAGIRPRPHDFPDGE